MAPNGTHVNGNTNGIHKREFAQGVWCPLVTPFKEGSEDLDTDALAAQVLRLAKANVGIVLLGTNGEAAHMSAEERSLAIKTARQTLDNNGFQDKAILAGTGGQSARETIQLCKEAGQAGADFAIVIHPGYFAFAMGKNRPAIKNFFTQVLDKSPIPVMIYNFPGAAAGIDLDSDILIELAEHQNCMGAKLTCAGIGKGHRLAAHTQSKAYKSRHPAAYHTVPGFSDYLLPALISRHSGCITGTSNIFPKTIARLYDLSKEALKTGDSGKMQEAMDFQDRVSAIDWVIVKAGIGGTKYMLNEYFQSNLGGTTRSPVPEADTAIKSMCDGLKEAVEFEKSL